MGEALRVGFQERVEGCNRVLGTVLLDRVYCLGENLLLALLGV
jgi:hypothetical protein